jgi:pyruvate dehydrogenase E2 component (dihydrolipoamide acetyltransferase)
MPEVTMPRLSDSMEEGTIIAWLKGDGDEVTVGEEIVEIETDKASMAYAAEETGTLQIVAAAGAPITVGATIAQIGEPAMLTVGATAPSSSTSNGHANESAVANGHGDTVVTGNGAAQSGRIKASPLARRMANHLGIALETLVGSGPGGRIVKVDIQEHAADTPVTAPAPALAQASGPAPGAPPKPALVAGTRHPVQGAPATPRPVTAAGTVQELTRLQQTIAQRMVRSRTEIPDFTVSIDIDAGPISELRAQLRAAAGEGRPTPSFNDMVVKASALALRDDPHANASYSENTVINHDRVNIGFAVAGQGALLVPVVTDADLKSLGQISRETRALAERVRSGQITPAELEGGTFTISNLGMYGVLECIPVINGSQAAILGVGAVRAEPVVSDGELAVGHRMRLTIVGDHRVLYGADAAQLLNAIRATLEQPLSLAL